MRNDFYFDSCGAGKIHCCKWMPEGTPKGIIQIVHGIAEFVERYDEFAEFMNEHGFIVVADDHMGHGKSINGSGTQGYFDGGWFAAVEDSYQLLQMAMKEYPDLPYILFGHSMGSFMVRTMLCKYPDSGICGAVICGTGWQARGLLPAAIKIADAICKKTGERIPSEKLNNIIFGGYNKKVEHSRTGFDWLTRDSRIVDAYIKHPLCGFTPTAGLFRDVLKGLAYIENPVNLKNMKNDTPVLFVAGGDDPVGSYGRGVEKTADAFRQANIENVTLRIYPLCRHEILNEINRSEIYEDLWKWIAACTNMDQKEK